MNQQYPTKVQTFIWTLQVVKWELFYKTYDTFIPSYVSITVADPGFPRGGGANLLFSKIYAEKCTKAKENEPGAHAFELYFSA